MAADVTTFLSQLSWQGRRGAARWGACGRGGLGGAAWAEKLRRGAAASLRGRRARLAPGVFSDAKVGVDKAKLLIEADGHFRRPNPGVGVAAAAYLLQQGLCERAAELPAAELGRRGDV